MDINLNKYDDMTLLDAANAGHELEAELLKRGYEHGWYKHTPYAKEVFCGCIYILINPAFENLVKIGYADDVEKRLKILHSNSGLPDPYHCYATFQVKKRLEDLKLHSLIDTLNHNLRHARNREFYEMTKEQAYKILSAIAQINGCEEQLTTNPLNDSYFEQVTTIAYQPAENLSRAGKKSTKPRFSFTALGINLGEEISFAEDPNQRFKVNGPATVEFEGRTWKLSTLARELKQRNGTCNQSGSYQGAKYFTFRGRLLTDIRSQLEDPN